ncbi:MULTISPECIES: AzlD domain-containing protein [Bacillaceae]|uniref:AzlD domain-containing protein n=1 Tax=Metabacillus sediminis TaxID=3117746 RepID=A0ABZ2NLN3_9BACI|nr:AzlD domain-containing protein [Bacillus sp. SJS]KZZ84544.1 branched-chain amino acid transporter [Bacillus sp. SJS]
MSESMILLIAGMAVATYIPRMVPFLVFRGSALPDFLQNVLKNVPYAILGALIVPAIFMTDKGFIFGAVGAAAAFAAGYLGWNVIFVVLASILAVMGYAYFFS